MKKNIYNIIILTALLTRVIFAQVEDSNAVSLEALLQANIDAVDYVESAAKYSQSPEEAPASVSIITSKEIESYGYQTLSEVLNSQAGFYISNDRNYDYLGVRGFSRPTDYNNRILLLVDGHRLNEYIYDASSFDRVLGLDISNFESVEIIRGPGSSLYGTSAMLAVINLIPKKLNNLLHPQIKLSYGSYNTKNIVLNAGQEFENGIRFSVNSAFNESDGEDIYFSDFDDPETNNGLAENLDYGKFYGLMGIFSYKNFKLSGYSASGFKKVPTAAWESDFNAEQTTLDQSKFLEASIHHNLSYNSQVSLKAYYDNYHFFGEYIYEGEFAYDKDDGKTIGTELQLIWDVLPSNRITAGLDYKSILRADYKYWDDYEVYNEFNVPYKILSFYIQDEYQFNSSLSLYLGIRSDNYLNIVNSISPRLGIVINPWKKHTFKLLYGNAFRAPNAYEQKYEDPLYGFKVNPNGLKPEKIYTSEFIWDYKINQFLNSNVAFYYYRVADLIDQIEDPSDGFYNFDNYGKTDAFGADISLEGKFSYSSGVHLRYSYQNAKDGNSSKLTNSPSHILKLGVFHKLISVINFSFEYIYGSKRITVYETETDPIHLAKLNIFTDNLFDEFKLSFSINNLLNKTIKYPGGWEHVQHSIIQPSRNYYFTISYGL